MNESPEVILIVDDEDSVRRTFSEWLQGANLGCTILTAGDAESALKIANQHPIDLAILDWNLGAGDDGLQLLQDLAVFHPDVIAILITGYANQATPLDAMRMGVRDYLDKNHDLNREAFLNAVRRQLEQIRPAKRVRRLHQSLVAFREAVEKILPLVQSTAALNDPVTLPDAVRSLISFALEITQAEDGVLLVRHYDGQRQPAEWCRAFAPGGEAMEGPLVSFNRSLAGTVASMQEPAIMNHLQEEAGGMIELQPFEEGRRRVLAAPLAVGQGVQAVLELFDKKSGPFTADDQRLAQSAADLGAELIRQAIGLRRQHQMLLDAVGAALGASERMAESLHGDAAQRLEQPPPVQVMDQLRQGLSAGSQDPAGAEKSVQLAEAIRVLGLRHGPAALEHCQRLVESVRVLLDRVTGLQE